MRISDDVSDKKLDKITLFLTEEETLQLQYSLKKINESKNKELHFHLTSDDYSKEITFCIYDPENIEFLHPRVQQLIKFDE